MQQLLLLFTHTWRADERGQLTWMTVPWGGKGSNLKSTSATYSSHLKFPILTVHLRDKTSEPLKRNCGRGGRMFSPLPLQWHELDNSIWLLLSSVHWLLWKACLWFQRNILQKEVLLTICNVGRIRFSLSISPLKGERKGMNIKA